MDRQYSSAGRFDGGLFFIIVSAIVIACSPLAMAHPSVSTALSEYQKQDWQVEDGLPQSNVRAIAQLHNGPLLVATSGGLASFDGMHFTPVKVDATDEVANEPVNALLVARNGDLWIGTDDRGVIRRRGDTSVALSEETGLHQERVRALMEDHTGVIWVATQNGIERILGDKIECLTSLGLVHGDMTTPFAEDGHGNVFVVTSAGLFLWKPSGVKPFPIRHPELGNVTEVYGNGNGAVWVGFQRGVLKLIVKPDGSYLEEPHPHVHGPVTALLVDRDGQLWVGTKKNGICRVSSDGVTHWRISDGLSDDTIRALYEDNEGDLWIGMFSGGISRWRKSTLIPFGEPEGLPDGTFAANVLGDQRGNLWFGTWGSGLLRIDHGTLRREHLPGAPLSDPIRALAEDQRGDVWIGTWFSGLYRYNGTSFQHFLVGTESPANAVAALLSDSRGRLWVGTYKGLIRFPTGVPEKNKGEVFLPGKLITSLKEDVDGSVVAGTFSGLYRISGSIVEEITKRDGLSNNFVLSVSTDRSGGLWVGTKAGGIDYVQGRRAIHLSTEAGIPAYPVFSVLDDGQGQLWMSTTRGVLRVPVQQMHDLAEGKRKAVDPLLLGKNDGMRSSECGGMSQPPAARSQDGSLWFATAKGFVHTAAAVSPVAVNPPEVHITGFSLDNVSQPPSEHLSLASGLANLEFEFNAIRLANPHQLQFRYKLQGYDRDWTVTRLRNVHYKRLPPGRYKFLVAVRDAGLPWSNNSASVEVEQKPFFYQTVWFYLLIATALGTFVAGLFRWRVARVKGQLQAVMEERNRIAREWHDTLMADFAAIAWQLEATKKFFADQSGEAISSFDLARNMVRHCQAEARRIIWDLRDGSEPVGPLSEALSKVLDAMNEKLDANTHLQVTGEETALPPLAVHHLVCICQEAVTNAVRHAESETIQVGLEYRETTVTLSVKDTGRGFAASPTHASPSGHFGLAVMQERARKLGGRLQVQSSPGAGSEILVDVPTGTAVGGS